MFLSLKLLLIVVLVCSADDENDFLKRFGYLPQISNAQLTSDVKDVAIRKFQRAYGLPINGKIDRQTAAAMKEPRCSLSDDVPEGIPRRKRSFGQAWKNHSITYGVSTWSQHLSPGTIEHLLRRAFDIWEREADIKFTRDSRPTIKIDFGKQRHPNCPYVFEDSVLAHAFPPEHYESDIAGDIHFNDLHVWTTSEYTTNAALSFLSVATHEIGHTLGLNHNTHEPESIMSPRDLHRLGKITDRDRYYIQALYGPSKKHRLPTATVTTTSRPRTNGDRKRNNFHVDTVKPQACTSSVDAVGTLRGNFFFFKDEWYWRYSSDGRPIIEPTLITTSFPDLPYPIDAALEVEDELWLFSGRNLNVLYVADTLRRKYAQRQLVDIGIPPDVTHIDLAYNWHYLPETAYYLWSGDVYWKLDKHEQKVEKTYPRPVERNWKHVPKDATAAFSLDKELHFIKDNLIYRMNSSDFRLPVEEGYPKSTSEFWTGCNKQRVTRQNRLSSFSTTFSTSFTYLLLTIVVFSLF